MARPRLNLSLMWVCLKQAGAEPKLTKKEPANFLRALLANLLMTFRVWSSARRMAARRASGLGYARPCRDLVGCDRVIWESSPEHPRHTNPSLRGRHR